MRRTNSKEVKAAVRLISKGDFSKQIISKVGASGVRFPGLLLPYKRIIKLKGGIYYEKRNQRNI